jgi:hypothetical protein
MLIQLDNCNGRQARITIERRVLLRRLMQWASLVIKA